MTIRYKCDACGAVMKIRDEKAGLQGHCPTCKAVFTVPQPGTAEAEASESGIHAEAAASSAGKAGEKQRQGSKAAKSAPAEPASAAPAADDDEFDPVAFLSGDEATPAGKPAPKGPAGNKSAKGAPAKGAAPAKAEKAAPGSDEDDFDPVSFLMDGPAPSRPQPAAPPAPQPPPSRPGARRPSTPQAPATPAGKPAGNTAAEKAGALLKGGSNASANAKELLSRSVEESRARSSEIPKEEKESRIDWAGVGSELRRVGPKVLGGIVAIVAIYYGMDAMLGGGIDLPHLGRVEGTVTLDGKPLPGAKVIFSSAERMVESRRGRQIKARAGTATTDEQGRYELIYLDNIRGTVVGRNRVQISKINEKGQEVIPPDYGMASKVFRNIEEGYQEIDIEVKTK